MNIGSPVSAPESLKCTQIFGFSPYFNSQIVDVVLNVE